MIDYLDLTPDYLIAGQPYDRLSWTVTIGDQCYNVISGLGNCVTTETGGRV